MTWPQIVAAYMPALVILVTVIMGALSNNRALEQVGKRIDDLRSDFNKRIDGLEGHWEKRIDDTHKRIDDTNKRIDELGDRLEARFDRLEARLEHPIARP